MIEDISSYASRALKLYLFKESIDSWTRLIEIESQIPEDEPYARYFTESSYFYRAACYYYLKDYEKCYADLQHVRDDYRVWVIDGLLSKQDMMDVLKGFDFSKKVKKSYKFE